VNIREFRGDKVAHETIYVSEGWDPPDWRAPWRSEPAEEARAEAEAENQAGEPAVVMGLVDGEPVR
jgi:hypothetical protein